MPAKRSAGVLMFRRTPTGPEVLLVHPGGPFWRNKDLGAWTIPKGEAAPGEDLFERAKIEFAEELGFTLPLAGAIIDLGWITEKGGKTVYAWALEGDLPLEFVVNSNTFEMEWPPHSGRRAAFPEIDDARYFSIDEARAKMNPAQAAFLDRLTERLPS